MLKLDDNLYIICQHEGMTASNQLRNDPILSGSMPTVSTDEVLPAETAPRVSATSLTHERYKPTVDLGGDAIADTPARTSHRLAIRSIRAIANADVAAMAIPRDSSSLRTREIDPPNCTVHLGHTLFGSAPPAKEAAQPETMELLLDGHLRWCRTIPPPGFAHAAVLSLPGRRLCILANRSRDRMLTESDLTKAVALADELIPLPLLVQERSSYGFTEPKVSVDRPAALTLVGLGGPG